ncbi:MAG: hypothetical protein K6E40_02395 [Desulfovibrio sp.]|nr:hypothetical protein [Desulfovibrio sp.]
MNDAKTKRLSRQAIAEMLAAVCRGKGCPATYELGCPFKDSEGRSLACDSVRPDIWLEAMEESAPQFQFGDKVTLINSTGSYNGIFNAYTEYERAYVLLEGNSRCSAEFVRSLRTGWKEAQHG